MRLGNKIPAPPAAISCRRAFTLAEVLAALALMAIIIPVAIHGMQVATRAGELGERKGTAMRIAERLLNENLASNQTAQATSNGTLTENGISYPWTIQSKTWSEDAMTELTVQVTFTVQGNNYTVSASTLYDPNAGTASTSSSTSTSTTSR